MGDNSPHTLQNQCFRLFPNKNLGRILVYLIVWMNTGFAKRGILGSILKMWHTGILQDALSLLNIVVSAVPIDWCCTWDCQWHFKSFDCTGFQQLHECAQLDFKQTYLCFGSNLCYRLEQNCTIVCHPGWNYFIQVTVEPQLLSTDAKITDSPMNKAPSL